MITASHAVVYADDPDQARAFFRDVLEMPNVDIRGGWLIFKLPPAELGIHPSGEGSPGGHHELFLMCDDIDQHRAVRTPDPHPRSRWWRNRSLSAIARHRVRPPALKRVTVVTFANGSVP